jgi:hypothetical protein
MMMMRMMMVGAVTPFEAGWFTGCRKTAGGVLW